MVRRICPICDQIMKSAHYCRNCKSFVRNPYIRETDYYLNERHPASEEHCSFHDPWEEEKGRSLQKRLCQMFQRTGSAASILTYMEEPKTALNRPVRWQPWPEARVGRPRTGRL